MNKIQVLQLGNEDFSKIMQVSDCAEWYYEPEFDELDGKNFDVVILAREITEDECLVLQRYTKAHGLFVVDCVDVQASEPTKWLQIARRGKVISEEQLKNILLYELHDYFPNSYGEKYRPEEIAIARGFSGNVKWDGYEGVELSGNYGSEFQQIIYWRNNLLLEKNQAIEFWLEYKKDASVEISLEIVQFVRGSVSEVQNVWHFSEEDLKEVVYIENKKNAGVFNVFLKAKGTGNLKVIALHDRHSRRGKGSFIPGGERLVTSDREEIFYYFDPGNLEPPLNVYFSGYKTREGFEGYYMMRKMKHPFLLIAEARLEGGAFYLGTQEYENYVVAIIKKYINALGFKNSQVIMSGLSMGTFGALYYGCKIHPHTILVGKPLASLGDMAANERLNRPGQFPTSLDVLKRNCGSMDENAIKRLNDRFWDKFDRTNWEGTKFAVAYMIEDDYDKNAYQNLLSHLKNAGTYIYGKGLHGRHNDNTSGIITWFVNQYNKIIKDDFEGKIENDR